MFYLLKDKFDKRCEVVFLCVGRKYFDVYKEEYDKLLKDENTDVRVIPLPLYYKNYDGSLRDMKLNFEEFSDIENVCKYDEYKYELIHPKQIYFQFPFDEYNDALSVPPYFYSRRLRKLTDELIYIPYLNPEDFTKENVREYANLKYYACVPGVVYADKVILSTEVMRTSYIAKLAEWLPEVSVKVWRNRITVSKDNIAEPDTDETTGKGRNDSNLKEEDRKKRLLYYVELGYLFRNKAETLCKIRNSIEIILKSEKIALSIAVDEADYEKFRRLMPDEMQEFRAILSGNNIGLIIEKREMYSKLVNDFDAFFGDGGLVAHMFRNAGKPVMLQNYFICGES